MLKEGLNKTLYRVVQDIVPKSVISNKNRNRSWKYGYDQKYGIVVISKTGQIEEIIEVSGLLIALPKPPEDVYKRSDNQKNQYFERHELPKPLSKIQSIFQWNEMPSQFKNRWVDYIEKEFDYREDGYWFYNKGKKTYITGAHYMYLQWTSIDVGYPDYREANRLLYIF